MNDKNLKSKFLDTSQRHQQHHHQGLKLTPLAKCQFCTNYKSQHQIIQTILQSKYLLPNNYYLNTPLVKHPPPIPSPSHDQSISHINHYHPLQSIPAYIIDLTEYYKYYGQKPTLFLKSFYSIFYGYNQHKKIIEYNRLKVLLSLEPTESGNCSLLKPNHNCFNILGEINNQSHDDQSVMVLRLRNKLSKYLSNPPTIQSIHNHCSHPLRNAICEDKAHHHSKKTIKSKIKSRPIKHKKNNHQSKVNIHQSKQKINLKSQQSVTTNYPCLTKNTQIPFPIRQKIIQFKNKVRKEKRKLIKSFGKSLDTLQIHKWK